MIGAQEVGKIIPFPVWIIPFSVYKSSFVLISKSRGVEKLILKLTSASTKVGVEARAELGKNL